MNFHNPYPIPRRFLEPKAREVFRTIDIRLRALAATLTGASGFLVLGPTGAGKSLAAAVGGALLARKHDEQWVQWIRADALTRLMTTRGQSETIDGIIASRYLILDELGYERWQEGCLEVIGTRHECGRPTLVTSGLYLHNLPSFTDRYSDATVRRITEIGDGAVIDCWEKPSPEAVAIATAALRNRARERAAEREATPVAPTVEKTRPSATEGLLDSVGRKLSRPVGPAEIDRRRREGLAGLQRIESEQ